jgi:hypothetical protein
MVNKVIKQVFTVDHQSFVYAYYIGLKAKKNFLTLDLLFLVTIIFSIFTFCW